MFADAAAVPVIETIDRARFEAKIAPAGRPVVFRGLAADWPAVQAGMQSAEALFEYLRGFDAGTSVRAFEADASIDGRFFYSDDLKGFNFERITLPFGNLLDRLLRDRGIEDARPLYAGAVPIPTHLPGLADAAPTGLLDPAEDRLTSLWIGSRTRTAAHWDLARNLACPILGRRRFTLFPPDQIHNLYIGPVDFTLAGQPVSLVDFKSPDLERFPRFGEAVRHAQVADLAPGDVLYLPSLWFHHVESLDEVGAMINFWWRDAPSWAVTPSLTLNHALLTLRDLPPVERAAWRAFFDHYVFRPDEGADAPLAHVPPDAQGLFGPMTEEKAARIRAMLARSLSR